MAADDWSIKPSDVETLEPEYPNIVTQSENYKKDYQNLSTTPTERFRLIFEGLSDANTELLYEHWKGRYGGYDSFVWLNAAIPANIIDLLDLGAANLTGRWVEKSLKIKDRSTCYDVEIIFEKAI